MGMRRDTRGPVTFFDWPHSGKNVPGSGSIAAIGLRVPSREALEWWQERFDKLGVSHEGIVEHAGRATIAFTDPEGQRLILADDGGKAGGTPWAESPVPARVWHPWVACCVDHREEIGADCAGAYRGDGVQAGGGVPFHRGPDADGDGVRG